MSGESFSIILAFTLENSKLEWIGEYEITEQELMSGKAGKQKETKLEQAMKLIRQILTTRNFMYVYYATERANAKMVVIDIVI